MTGTCPTCGQPWPEGELELLRAHAGELGIFIDLDDAVDEAGAARLLGKCAKTLRNMRSELRGPGFIKRGGRVRYPLQNLLSDVPAMSLEDPATQPTIAPDDLTPDR